VLEYTAKIARYLNLSQANNRVGVELKNAAGERYDDLTMRGRDAEPEGVRRI
jgi:hypothetical protein